MSKILNILRIQMAVIVAYRGTIFFWLCIHVVGFVVMYAFWTAVFSDRGDLHGFGLPQMLQYILITNLIREFVLVAPEYEINEAIREGKLSNALLRPFSYPLHTLISSTFWHIIESVLAFIIYSIIGVLILGHNPWDFSVYTLLLTLPVILLGHTFCSLLSFILGSLAFWLSEASAFFYYKEITILLTSGLFFPKSTTPLWFQQIMEFLPFYHTIGVPAEIIVNRSPTASIWHSLYHLALWNIIALISATYMWNKGIKKYESVGN